MLRETPSSLVEESIKRTGRDSGVIEVLNRRKDNISQLLCASRGGKVEWGRRLLRTPSALLSIPQQLPRARPTSFLILTPSSGGVFATVSTPNATSALQRPALCPY